MNIILGHLIGDYIFQSDWMAVNKKNRSFTGFIACLIHCLLWTLSVYAFGFNEYSMMIMIPLFISHFILDRYNLVKWFLNETGIMPNPAVWKIIIVDNTLHLFFIYLIKEYLIW